MARASTRLLERLAVQAQQPRVPTPAPIPRTSVPPQSSRPNGVPARPAPAPGQGRGVRPAGPPPTPPIDGRLTLGAAVPPDMAARIAAVRVAAKPQAQDKAPADGKVAKEAKFASFAAERPAQPSRANATSPKPKHDGPHPMERLAALYPAVFDIHAPKPLAIGVHEQIAAALADLSHGTISRLIKRWASRVNYLSATAAPGSRRFNLDGSDAGEVSDDHRAHAAETLARKLAPNTPGALAAGSHNSPLATGKDRDMARISATARKMKVTTVLDVAAFADMPPISDNAPSRTALTVNVAGRKFTADIATKSVRRALAVIAEHGADGVAVLVQGTLGAGDEIVEAGLVAQPKAPAKAAA